MRMPKITLVCLLFFAQACQKLDSITSKKDEIVKETKSNEPEGALLFLRTNTTTQSHGVGGVQWYVGGGRMYTGEHAFGQVPDSVKKDSVSRISLMFSLVDSNLVKINADTMNRILDLVKMVGDSDVYCKYRSGPAMGDIESRYVYRLDSASQRYSKILAGFEDPFCFGGTGYKSPESQELDDLVHKAIFPIR
ncbi:MAG: hypothetical protein JWP91_852 [Fibrobacteres bacterium]|nr:hypothetical protein [Fibrobacterota bacterium]